MPEITAAQAVLVVMQTLATDYSGFQYGVGLIWIRIFSQATVQVGY
jgi:hypothetical protein